MKKKRVKSTLIDEENPELTDAFFKNARPARDVLPSELYTALTARKPGQRGKQKKPTKKGTYIRFDAEVIDYFKSTGDGWQSRINNLLKAVVANLIV